MTYVVIDKFSDYCGACMIHGVAAFSEHDRAVEFAKTFKNGANDKVEIIQCIDADLMNDGELIRLIQSFREGKYDETESI